jgi:hypothetical protein
MANAAVLTVTELTANDWKAQPSGAAFDTGTVAVTVYGTIDPYKSGQIVMEVSNGGTAALTATVLAGDEPPAFRAGLGNEAQSIGAGSAWMFGPFETARFMQDDGTFGLPLTPTGTIAGTVRVYALPTV